MMSYATAIQAHPMLTDGQRETLARLIRMFGSPFAFSVSASMALPTWQNIGTVGIRHDGDARKIHNGEAI